MSAQVAADLRAAAEVLRRDGWTQGRFFDEETGCRCVAGALQETAAEPGQWMSAVEALAGEVGASPWPTSIYAWNDEPKRTADEVIAALEAAANAAEVTA